MYPRDNKECRSVRLGYLGTSFSLTSDDSHLVFLPFSHFQQRMLPYVAAMLGMDVMVTTPERLFNAMPRFATTMIVAPPTFYESIEIRVRSRSIEGAGGRDAGEEINCVLGPLIRWLFIEFAPIRKETLELGRSDMALGPGIPDPPAGMITHTKEKSRHELGERAAVVCA